MSIKEAVPQRRSELSPAKRALLEKRLRGLSNSQSKYQAISRRSKQDEAPLSFGQQRLWFFQQLEPDSPVYHRPSAIRLTGPLNVKALHRALEAIVARHEVLRTTFATVGGDPVQVIAGSQTVKLLAVDLRAWPETERGAEARRLAGEEIQRPFDLARGPLMRATLMRLGEEEHVLLLIIHHIVFDGWSMDILKREVGAFYNAFATAGPSPLPELPIQYADFADWQRQQFVGEVSQAQLAYWKQQLAGASSVLDLPTDHPRPTVRTYKGARQLLKLSRGLTEALKSLSRSEGVTLFMTLLAALQILLSRYTSEDDISVGTPIAGRTRAETESLIGFFVNTLVMRTDLSGDPTFRELLGRVRQVALGAYAHQDLPFEKLVEELQPGRSLSHTPLFQVMFVLQNTPRSAVEFQGLKVRPLAVDSRTSMFDMTLAMGESAEGFSGHLEYSTDLFDASTINRMLGHFQVLLEAVAADPEQPLSQLPLLTEAERHQLLGEWNDTHTEYPKECIHKVFEEQVRRTPEAVAVVFEGQRLTYRELNTRANQVAQYLRRRGVGPEIPVGICMERSVEMVVGMLGILKAGGAYVPLDPAYPQARLRFMLDDVAAPVIITQRRLVEYLPGYSAEVICLDADWEVFAAESAEGVESGATAENLAYVIHTSGSTGKPKGVTVAHRSVVRLVKETDYARFAPDETFYSLPHSPSTPRRSRFGGPFLTAHAW